MPNLEDIELVDLMIQVLRGLGYKARLFRENTGFSDIEVGSNVCSNGCSNGCRAFVGVTKDLKIFIRCRGQVCFHGSAYDPNTINKLADELSQHCLSHLTCDCCEHSESGVDIWSVVKCKK